MTRDELIEYIQGNYDASIERPWSEYPNYVVCKHKGTAIWFALIMDVPAKALYGNDEEYLIDIIDLKVAPELIGSLQLRRARYPAYYMDKDNWVSIGLESNIRFGELKLLISDSFRLTEN